MILDIVSRHGCASAGIVLFGDSDAVLSASWGKAVGLTMAERGRAAAFVKEGNRRDFRAAHVLVRVAAAALTGGRANDFVLDQCCDVCGGPHGRPTLRGHPELQVSLSHTNGVVAAACSDTGAGIGVDVERWEMPCLDHSVLKLVLSDGEQALIAALPSTRASNSCFPPPATLAFLRLWVRKEALIKLGVTTIETLSRIDLSAMPSDQALDRLQSWIVTHDAIHFTEWHDPTLQISGSAAGDGPYDVARVFG
jgi:4'-phosphopantetheinyl transferase